MCCPLLLLLIIFRTSSSFKSNFESTSKQPRGKTPSKVCTQATSQNGMGTPSLEVKLRGYFSRYSVRTGLILRSNRDSLTSSSSFHRCRGTGWQRLGTANLEYQWECVGAAKKPSAGFGDGYSQLQAAGSIHCTNSLLSLVTNLGVVFSGGLILRPSLAPFSSSRPSAPVSFVIRMTHYHMCVLSLHIGQSRSLAYDSVYNKVMRQNAPQLDCPWLLILVRCLGCRVHACQAGRETACAEDRPHLNHYWGTVWKFLQVSLRIQVSCFNLTMEFERNARVYPILTDVWLMIGLILFESQLSLLFFEPVHSSFHFQEKYLPKMTDIYSGLYTLNMQKNFKGTSSQNSNNLWIYFIERGTFFQKYSSLLCFLLPSFFFLLYISLLVILDNSHQLVIMKNGGILFMFFTSKSQYPKLILNLGFEPIRIQLKNFLQHKGSLIKMPFFQELTVDMTSHEIIVKIFTKAPEKYKGSYTQRKHVNSHNLDCFSSISRPSDVLASLLKECRKVASLLNTEHVRHLLDIPVSMREEKLERKCSELVDANPTPLRNDWAYNRVARDGKQSIRGNPNFLPRFWLGLNYAKNPHYTKTPSIWRISYPFF
ncbi:putative signal peptide protein [Puccinia sorghi]|uniref:Putative signal peptide protein n=1 Tax=Puccinia sorghi TaxID=27349 RepID=A0A0L6VD11_9BASI|nr:putative signal peptide protein [Puccinia sorghi]